MQKPTIQNLLECVELIKNRGDVVVIKLDGQRDESQYTVFITSSSFKDDEIIRAGRKSLKEALHDVIKSYVEYFNENNL